MEDDQKIKNLFIVSDFRANIVGRKIKSCSTSVSQYRTAVGGNRVNKHHQGTHSDVGDFGFETALQFPSEMYDISGRAAHIE